MSFAQHLQRTSAVLAVTALVACRTMSADRGPLRAGDDVIARERIERQVRDDDGAPPPPPVDTLSMIRLSTVPAAAAPGAAARATPAPRALGLRARYYLREDGTRGWIAFPQELQPTGVTVDSAARVVIRDGRIGGAGTITLRDERGTLVLDLATLRGAGSEIGGSCGPRQPGRGACATLVFEGASYIPANGAARTERVALEIGADPPG